MGQNGTIADQVFRRGGFCDSVRDRILDKYAARHMRRDDSKHLEQKRQAIIESAERNRASRREAIQAKRQERAQEKLIASPRTIVAIDAEGTERLFKNKSEAVRAGFGSYHLISQAIAQNTSLKGHFFYTYHALKTIEPEPLSSNEERRCRSRPPSRCKPVIGKPLAGGRELYFVSVREAVKAGFNKTSLQQCAVGRTPKYKGYQWRYAYPGEKPGHCVPFTVPKMRNSGKMRPVIARPVKGGMEVLYGSVAEVLNDARFTKSPIFRSLKASERGRLSQYGEYVWRYAHPGEKPRRVKPITIATLQVIRKPPAHKPVIATPAGGGTALWIPDAITAAVMFPLKREQVAAACRSHALRRGYHWRYALKGETAEHIGHMPPQPAPVKPKRPGKPVMGIPASGEGKTYRLDYCAQAALFGFNPIQVAKCAKGRLRYHRGYEWRFTAKAHQL